MDDTQARRKAAAIWFLMGQGIAAAMHDKLREQGYSMPAETFAGFLGCGKWAGAVGMVAGLSEADRVQAFQGGVQFAKDMFEGAVTRIVDGSAVAVTVEPLQLMPPPNRKAN